MPSRVFDSQPHFIIIIACCTYTAPPLPPELSGRNPENPSQGLVLIRQTVNFYFFPLLLPFGHTTPPTWLSFPSPPPGSRLLASLSTHLHTHPPTPSERDLGSSLGPHVLSPVRLSLMSHGKLLRRGNAAQILFSRGFVPRACTVYFTIRVLF